MIDLISTEKTAFFFVGYVNWVLKKDGKIIPYLVNFKFRHCTFFLLISLIMSQTQRKGTTFYSSFTSSWRTEVMPAHHQLSCNHYWEKIKWGLSIFIGTAKQCISRWMFFYNLCVWPQKLKCFSPHIIS